MKQTILLAPCYFAVRRYRNTGAIDMKRIAAVVAYGIWLGFLGAVMLVFAAVAEFGNWVLESIFGDPKDD